MNNNTINIWKFGCIILTIIAIILLVIVLKNHSEKNDTNNNNNQKISKSVNNSNDDIDNNIRIMLDEDLSKDGIVEGIENLTWNNARIRQMDNEIEVSIMLNNQSETEKIPSHDLTINLLDKDKKVIFTKDIKMKEISSQYGYTSLELTCEITEPVVIYDIQIEAK